MALPAVCCDEEDDPATVWPIVAVDEEPATIDDNDAEPPGDVNAELEVDWGGGAGLEACDSQAPIVPKVKGVEAEWAPMRPLPPAAPPRVEVELVEPPAPLIGSDALE